MANALVLVSGGQLSTVALACAVQGHGVDSVHTLTVRYGQQHESEISAARCVVEALGIASAHRHELDVGGLLRTRGSAAVDALVPVPKYQALPAVDARDPGHVPGRNLALLFLAAQLSVQCHAEIVYIGTNLDAGRRHPDARSSFFSYAELALRATFADTLVVATPLISFDRAEVCRMGERLAGTGMPIDDALAESHTCESGPWPPCGQCRPCLARAAGFRESNIEDPHIRRLRAETEEG